MRTYPFILTFFIFYLTNIHAQKFVPKNGGCLLFVGQDLESVGGLENYNNGYVDHFKTPAGITLYTNLSPHHCSFGSYLWGLDGLTEVSDWGAGESCGDLYLESEKFNNTAIAIGVSFVNNEKKVANGELDDLIVKLAQWVKTTQRPVLLRIGYEFDGWDWNHYNRKDYLKCWQKITQIFKEEKVDNVAFVWQSKGNGTNQKTFEKWYPGDDLVDWVGYSYFGQPDEEMLHFARAHNKPVFIAEATPVRQMDGLYFDCDLKKENLSKVIWKEWYAPFFETLKKNQDIIKAVSYINANWSEQTMWVYNPTFQKVDARIQMNTYITQKWKEQLDSLKLIHASNQLYEIMGFE